MRPTTHARLYFLIFFSYKFLYKKCTNGHTRLIKCPPFVYQWTTKCLIANKLEERIPHCTFCTGIYKWMENGHNFTIIQPEFRAEALKVSSPLLYSSLKVPTTYITIIICSCLSNRRDHQLLQQQLLAWYYANCAQCILHNAVITLKVTHSPQGPFRNNVSFYGEHF